MQNLFFLNLQAVKINFSYATNATSERSFSALQRVKTYLRSTTKQERLNHASNNSPYT